VKVYRGLEELEPPLAKSVLTVGNFDGVHRAHQQLLAQAGLFAADQGVPAVAMTFDPHPLAILAPEKVPARLSTLDDKLREFERAETDVAVVLRTTRELLALEARAFVKEVLVNRFHPTHVVEGPSFGFGRGRSGNPEVLRELGKEFGFAVHIIEPMTLVFEGGDPVMVSSSLIRALLREGKVHRAALCLGRPYTVGGPVQSGAKRGRQLGFPTANVHVREQMLPADGVYAGRVRVGEEWHLSAISVGSQPTFADGVYELEAYLLDFAGDLYDREVRVEFQRFLRPQEKYDDIDALIRQMKRDVEDVRRSTEWHEA
jgi:riboflavin kinase/FMN adenylyltransferase